jgi:hypothetical protein
MVLGWELEVVEAYDGIELIGISGRGSEVLLLE